MSVKYEQPVVTKGDRHGSRELVESHPAYGQIRASRVSGRTALYGSDFVHDHYMTVAITRSETTRTLSTDWPHPKGCDIIEVAMSESQWAAFISTPNSGTGTRCTITDIDGVQIPQIPVPVDRGQQFRAEMIESVKRAQNELAALRAEVEGLKLSGVARKALTDRLRQAEMATSSSIDFVAKQFGEHVEETFDRAKTEVEAYIEARIRRAGVEALGIGEPLIRLPERPAEAEPLPILDVQAATDAD